MMEYFGAFAISPLFRLQDARRLRSLLSTMETRTITLSNGEPALCVGLVTKEVLLIAQGSLLIQAPNAWEGRTNLGTVQRGEVCAAALAASGERSPVDIIAQENDTVVIAISVEELSKDRELEANLRWIIAGEAVEQTRKVALLRQRSVRDKILYFLTLEQQRHHGKSFWVPLKKKELADLLCVDPSALFRELTKLQEEGIVTVKGNLYTLH